MRVLSSLLKALRPAPPKPAPPKVAGLFAPAYGPAAGWWQSDPAEQLRNYRSWVYAAVNAIAQEAAKHRPQLYLNTGQADHDLKTLPHTHPLARLLDRPNPWLTPWELWYLTVVYLELTGNCFWYVAPQSVGDTRLGTPGEIWLIPTPWVTVLPDAREFVKGYRVAAPGAAAETFGPDEVIHLKYPNPLDPHLGLSPLQANALAVDANTELLRARVQTFQNGPRPGVVLRTEQTLTDQTVTRLEDKIQAKFAGRDNWHRPLILEQGLAASPWTLTPAEMDFLNSSRMTRDEILAVFRVPPPITGIVENMGLGADIWFGARVMFCEGAVQPKLDLIGQCLTRDLGRRYGPDVAMSFPDCSPRNADQRRKDDETDARLGLRTVNEIRRGRGLEPYPDARFDSPFQLGEPGA
ncbi:MAG TPA: phage portal protein [Urbifossiella sp.]|nr:phage portal protein [Urbifossiella sp.]